MEPYFFQIFVMFIFFASAVSGRLNITRCSGPSNDSYTCPRLFDPPERTHCCIWDSQPACCLPGGSSCSDSADKRNYCPRPDDGSERTHCCVWDSQPACCLPGGSSCPFSDDIRNYCPGPNDGKNDRKCCLLGEEEDTEPGCCKESPKLLPLWIFLGIFGPTFLLLSTVVVVIKLKRCRN